MKLQEIQAQQRQMAEHLVDSLGDVLEVAADNLSDAETGRRVRSVLTSRGGVERLQDDCAAVTAWSGDNYLPLLWQLYRRHRRSLYRLVRGLRLAPTSQDRSLLDALTVVLASQHRRADWIEAENLDLSFASERWRKLVVKQDGQRTRLNRRQLEICVFSCLASELKSCDVSVEGSEAYADYRKQLLPWAECEPLIADYCQKLELPNTASGFVDTLRRELEEAADAVDKGFPDNQEVHISTQGEPTLRRVTARDIPASAQVLEAAIHERMPVRNVLDILCNVEHWTHWTRHFGPLSGSDPKLDSAVERYILTAFALGTNLGVYQGARHMPELVTAQMLSFVNRRHITVEKLEMARQDIIDQYSRLGLPRYWGQGKSAAVDGTLYELYEQNLLANYHFRYQKKGAIAFHVVSDMYIALFSHFIPPGVWEAIYIIEALLSNKSSIQPDTVYADTQGQSATVFAFTHLLGIKLMPRIRNWKDLTFFRPDKDARYTHIDSLFKDAIDWQLIERHWQDLMQVVLSIRAGTVSSATLLRKLGNYSRKNRLYQAAREVGRAVRTIFLLNWISDYSLRRKVTDGTNKVEAYHGFSKWVSFGGEGVIGENDPDEQQKRIRYNDLVATAIIFQNIVDMTQAVEDLESDGFPVNRDDLAYLSPYITRSLKRFGDYFMHFDHAPDPLEEIIRSRWVAPVKDEVAASSPT